ncbi:hypothetical protein [Blastopirellula marina]|nr:hypothetical protein [Blastopirellula marina]
MATDTSAQSKDDQATLKSTVPAWAKPAKKSSTGVDCRNWEAWRKHLATRTQPVPLQTLVSGKKSPPLAWALFPDEVIDTRTIPLVTKLGEIASGRTKPTAKLAGELEGWLGSIERRIAERNLILEMLAWAHALPRLAQVIDAKLWWQAIDKLMSHAQDAAATNFTNKIFEQGLAGELPLTLAYLFPELAACRELGKPAVEVLDQGMQALTDGEGLPKVEHLLHLRALLACWTRSLVMTQATSGLKLSKDAYIQYQWMVRQALRLTRADGTQTLETGISGAYNKHLFQTSLVLGDDQEDDLIGQFTLPKGKGKASDWQLPLPSYESDWSKFACLRSHWQRTSPRFTVRHDFDLLIVELESREEVIFSGLWDTKITIDGVESTPVGEWDQVGWLADEDGDYLELEQEWTHGVRLQRLVFLAREDEFLWVMDSVLLDEPAQKIEYEAQPPIVQQAKIQLADETCEAFLTLPKSQVTLLPVGINEWRSDSLLGKCELQEGKLTMRQVGQGKALVAPLFVDLSKKGQGKPLTWRQCTVAEKLVIQPRDRAVGYRVQTGAGHWLFYRSLTGKASRTFMGVNLISEAIVARLDENGDIEKLLEVQAT